VAHEKALFVVVGVYEPAGDVGGGAGADLAGGGVIDVEALDLDDDFAALSADLYVRLAKDHKEVAGAGFLEQGVAHGQVRVHAGGEDGQVAIAAGFLRHVGVEGKAADDEQVKADAADRLFGGLFDQLRADGTVLRADGHAHPPRRAVPKCDIKEDHASTRNNRFLRCLTYRI
jgi:hypothetical protein